MNFSRRSKTKAFICEYIISLNMTSELQQNRLEKYVENYEDSKPDGMEMSVNNVEGGGSNVPDESEYYDNRLEWLNTTNGGHFDNIWSNLANNRKEGESLENAENKELVYIELPGWFIPKKDELKRIFGSTDGGSKVSCFAILKPETSDGKDGYAFSEFKTGDGINQWSEVRNQYSMVWVSRKICTVYRRESEPRGVDKATIYSRDALPEEKDPFECDDDDYDWRLALGAAYRRKEGTENDPLVKAYNEAQELPDKLYERVELGVEEYITNKSVKGEEPTDDEIALIVNTLTSALEPGATVDNDD